MKIAFLASTYTAMPYKEYYSTIINYLTQQGHNIVKYINESDLTIAECSLPSINIGYEISHALQNEKDVIILKSKDSGMTMTAPGLLNSDKKVYIYEYNKNNLISTLQEALQFNSPKKYKKFNVLFTTAMVTKLNLISKKKNLPKSVYIRQLIEKSLEQEDL